MYAQGDRPADGHAPSATGRRSVRGGPALRSDHGSRGHGRPQFVSESLARSRRIWMKVMTMSIAANRASDIVAA